MMKVKTKKPVIMTLVLALAMTLAMPTLAIRSEAAKKAGISKKTATIYVGETVTLKVTGMKSVKWTTSSKKIATIAKGKVKGVKAGKATITAAGKVNGKAKKLTCKVTVKAHTFTLDESKMTLDYYDYEEDADTADADDGDTDVVDTTDPEDADDDEDIDDGSDSDGSLIAFYDDEEVSASKVTWKSDNTGVVTVKNGELYVVSTGKATITASYKGMTAKCVVTVQEGTDGEDADDDEDYVDDETYDDEEDE